MMVRKSKKSDEKIASSGRKFTDLVRAIPTGQFVRMVSKCGLPTPEARELCQAFKDLKE